MERAESVGFEVRVVAALLRRREGPTHTVVARRVEPGRLACVNRCTKRRIVGFPNLRDGMNYL
jgi:hypothetical protein